MTIPPYLKKGDTIGMVCPSGFMAYEKAQTAITVLQEWGFQVKTGATLGSDSKNYFSGTDEERLEDLQQMMDDRSVNAIMCARGGYGMSRIIDKISFKKFKKHPKWIIGFSDITVLQCHLLSVYKIASLHAPMAAAFNERCLATPGRLTPGVESLHSALLGDKATYTCASNSFNTNGSAKGRLVGGNLSLLAHITGTASAISTKNKILFIEDVGEYIYNVDRMLYQLLRSGQLEKLAGLIVGGFTEIKDTTTPFGQTVEEVIRDRVKDYDYPVCFNFPVSHEKENYALKIGVRYKLTVAEKVTLEEY